MVTLFAFQLIPQRVAQQILGFHLYLRLHYETVKEVDEVGLVWVDKGVLNGVGLDEVGCSYF